MANGHGGARTPSKPAPVSGPGRLAKRTDSQPVRSPGGLPYGENADFKDLQSSAPMAQAASPTPDVRQGSAAAMSAPLPTPINAPTQRPDEPVTAGASVGAGPGPESLSVSGGIKGQSRRDAQELKKYLPSLVKTANSPNAPASFVKFVQYLRDI